MNLNRRNRRNFRKGIGRKVPNPARNGPVYVLNLFTHLWIFTGFLLLFSTLGFYVIIPAKELLDGSDGFMWKFCVVHGGSTLAYAIYRLLMR